MSQSSSCITSAEYVALAEKLQNVAQSLLSLSTAQTPDIFSDVPSNTPLLDIPSELPPQVPVSTDVREVHSVSAGDEVRSFNIDSGDSHSIDGSEVRSVDADESHSINASDVRSAQKTNISSNLPPQVPVSTDAREVHSVDAGEVHSFDKASGDVNSIDASEARLVDVDEACSIDGSEVCSVQKTNISSKLPPQVPVPTDTSGIHLVDVGEVRLFNIGSGDIHFIDGREVHSVDASDVRSFDIGSGDIHSIDGSEVHSVDADGVCSIGASEVRSVHKPNISSKLPLQAPVSTDAREVHSVDVSKVRSFDKGSGDVHSIDGSEVRSVSAGEVRSFFFPAPAIQLERELLQKHRTESFQGLLEEVYELLIGLIKLMQSVHKDARFRGHIIISLGMQLSHVSSLLLRMRTIYDKVVPLQTKNK